MKLAVVAYVVRVLLEACYQKGLITCAMYLHCLDRLKEKKGEEA